MKLLIKNGRVVDPVLNINKKMDLLIEDGKVKLLKEKINRISKSTQVIDAKGCIVTPGLIDAHVHLRDPGFEDREDILSGTLAAVKGGFTSVMCMPNTSPALDSVSGIRYVIDRGSKSHCKVFPVGAISKNREGKELAEIGRMAREGIVAVSDDGNCIQNSRLMRNAFEYIKMFSLKIIEHPEDKNLSEDGQINEGYMSTKLGLPGIPAISETLIISRDILMSEYFDVPVHFAHVSTKSGIDLIKSAKKKKIKVTCEVTPHHLVFNEEAMKDFNTNLKMKPPLRSEQDRKALEQAFRDGTIDILATDHAPHRSDEKEREFDLAPFGVVGLETSLSVMIRNYINTKKITWPELVRRMSSSPAEIFQLEGGSLGVGSPGDVTIINQHLKWVVTADTLAGKSKNSPFLNEELPGMVMFTIVNGKIAYAKK